MSFEERYKRLLDRVDAATEAAKDSKHYRHQRVAKSMAIQAYELAIENSELQKALDCAEKYDLGPSKIERVKSLLED